MIKALQDHGKGAKKMKGMTTKNREPNKMEGYENIRS